MARRLCGEEVVTIKVLARKGLKKRAIARQLGVTDRAVRYHLERAEAGAKDGQKNKVFKAALYADAIGYWMRESPADRCSPNILELHEHLVREHGYEGSYKSVLRYVRAHFPKPKIRTYRRVETPPGAQTQTDWGEFPRVDIGDGPQPMHAFVMVLSHSRKPALVWSRSEDQLSWLRCHNEAYRRLRGVAAVNRIDNLKTGIASGAGAWGRVNPVYRTYAKTVGFHVDACPPRAGNAKGKVEAKVKLGRYQVNPYERPFDSIEDLQAMSDERFAAWCKQAICPITGTTVEESWESELPRLAPVPILPDPFDVVVTRPVHRDCSVSFEGRSYAVPFRFVGSHVEVRGCAGTIQILAGGKIVQTWPRGTPERVLVDPSCYEGVSTDLVAAPPPLGRMGEKLRELLETPVEQRPIDLYAALAEVAR